ncbi:MAG TPA: dihydrolipoamide acetyltransferase family protein [Humisphaera sp.]|nr:dihydrolipoamide acetyltransferase family protein [Humisphaera sp.]
MVARATGNPNDFNLPDLGEGLEEAELIEWCVHVGQRVEENDILAKMETAKALVEVPSPRAGTIAVLHGKPGEAIKVGAPLVTYRDESQVDPEPEPLAASRANHQGNGKPEDEQETRPDSGTVVGSLGDEDETHDKTRAAPAVRRLARDLGVEIDHVHGTGIGGRVTRADVEAAAGQAAPVQARVAEPTPAPTKRTPVESPMGPVETARDEPALSASRPELSSSASRPQTSGPASRPAPTSDDNLRIPLRGVRKVIAEHLRHSVSNAIHYTVMDEADVSALDELRRKLMAAANEKISFLPFVAFAVCRVLTGRLGSQYRRLNATVDDQKQEIVQHRPVHLGIATDTESGLMVPVIRNADRMGVLEISRHIARLAHAARDRSIPADELSGSTFTISNFGSLGGRFGTPIINYPEAGILAIGRAREGVVVRRGMLGVGKLLPLSLSADHRVIDGATSSSALAKIIELLQSPDELLPPARQEA